MAIIDRSTVLDAGIMTPVIVLYARWCYRMRQRRWRALAKGMTS
jgi:hypothetical protein